MIETTRDFELELGTRLHQTLPFIQVLVGPRQVGKTTAAIKLFNNWQGPKIFVSADDPTPKSAEWLKIQWSEASSKGENTLFIIDEVQKIHGWAETLKALYDPVRTTTTLRILLLGSASLSIQQGLSASLAGRFELLFATHWTYKESAHAFKWDLEKYLRFGGYPAAALLLPDEIRWQSYILNSIIEPVLGRDIGGLIPIAKPALFRQTFELAMSYPAQVISYTKLLGQLQEGGNSSTIRHYLELMEGAFLIKLLNRYSRNEIQRRASSPKIIPLAPALSQVYRPVRIPPNDPTWNGHILEALVGAALARLPGKLSYWSESDYEVDYIHEYDGKVVAYEVKSSRKRKAKSLEQFLKKNPKTECKILSIDEIERLLLE